MKDPTGAPTQPGEILHVRFYVYSPCSRPIGQFCAHVDVMLQMANYLGVTSVVSALLNGFRDIFHSLDTERGKSTSPYGNSNLEVPEDPNIEYLSRVRIFCVIMEQGKAV